VFRVTATYVKSFQNGNQVLKHDKTCPACGTDNDPILLGVRNATMGAVAVEQSWASPYNDDKKLIAFSDSVQDAAHRAGFFSARTYLNTVRIGLTKVIDSFDQDQIPFNEFLDRVRGTWGDPSSSLHMDAERFVSEFIGPNMTWQRDWAEELLEKGRLPGNSRLPERVAKRLRWQAFAEFTYIGRRGRNLETLGKAVLAPDPATIESVAARLLPILKEQYGLRHLEASRVFQWVWGVVTQMKLRGGVADPEMETYMRDGRFKGFYFAPMRREWLPAMGLRTSHPRFLVDGELVGQGRVLSGGGGGDFGVNRAQPMLGENFLRFLGQEKGDKGFRHFTGAMFVNRGVHHGNRVLNQDRRAGQHHVVLLPALLRHQHFIFVGDCHITNALFKVGDAFARALVHDGHIFENAEQKCLGGGIVILGDAIHKAPFSRTIEREDIPHGAATGLGIGCEDFHPWFG
jgi:DEAD/DEAH box helicase domain-containing protein